MDLAGAGFNGEEQQVDQGSVSTGRPKGADVQSGPDNETEGAAEPRRANASEASEVVAGCLGRGDSAAVEEATPGELQSAAQRRRSLGCST